MSLFNYFLPKIYSSVKFCSVTERNPVKEVGTGIVNGRNLEKYPMIRHVIVIQGMTDTIKTVIGLEKRTGKEIGVVIVIEVVIETGKGTVVVTMTVNGVTVRERGSGIVRGTMGVQAMKEIVGIVMRGVVLTLSNLIPSMIAIGLVGGTGIWNMVSMTMGRNGMILLQRMEMSMNKGMITMSKREITLISFLQRVMPIG